MPEQVDGGWCLLRLRVHDGLRRSDTPSSLTSSLGTALEGAVVGGGGVGLQAAGALLVLSVLTAVLSDLVHPEVTGPTRLLRRRSP